jgi:gliding motility-associated-like protein
LRASGAFAYQWYLNGAVLEGATSAGFAARLPGEYRVEFITDKGCRAMGVSGISLELIRKPTAEINYDLFCKGLPVNFTAQTNQGGNAALAWSWDMGDGSLRRSGRSISYIYDRPGTYEVRLTVTPTLCSSLSATYIRKIDIDSIAGPLRYPMVNAVIDKPTPLQARDIGAVWRWDPAIQLSSSVLRDPVFRGDRGQQYLITIRKPSGCVTVDTLQVRVVRESGIFVPAGFSPDNDGHNDRLFPHLVGIREMKRFRVFNRWGALVFDDRNANATTGWDGTFRGRPQPAETYAWVAEGVDFDGQVMIRTGNVVLIR